MFAQTYRVVMCPLACCRTLRERLEYWLREKGVPVPPATSLEGHCMSVALRIVFMQLAALLLVEQQEHARVLAGTWCSGHRRGHRPSLITTTVSLDKHCAYVD